MCVFEFPLKQSFLDYFSLKDVDRNVNTGMLNHFFYEQLKICQNPCEKALDIWDKFVDTNDDFFDLFGEQMTKEKLQQYRERIQNTNNIIDICTVFIYVGCSPFCHKSLPKITKMT